MIERKRQERQRERTRQPRQRRRRTKSAQANASIQAKESKSLDRGLLLLPVVALALFAVSMGLRWMAPPSSDELSSSETMAIKKSFDDVVASGARFGLRISPTDPDLEDMVRAAYSTVDPTVAYNIIKDTSGSDAPYHLARVVVWDNLAVDGDVVVLSTSVGFSVHVPITNEPTTLYVPYESGNPYVTMQGEIDGGGGITVSVYTDADVAITLPPILPSQSINLRLG